MGLIGPIDKNARDVTSTTHVLASWRIFSCTGFFFLSNLYAFCVCIWRRFCSFSLRIRFGWAICESLQDWLRSECEYVINNEDAVNASRRRHLLSSVNPSVAEIDKDRFELANEGQPFICCGIYPPSSVILHIPSPPPFIVLPAPLSRYLFQCNVIPVISFPSFFPFFSFNSRTDY